MDETVEPPNEFPSTISFADLQACHPDYDLDKIGKYAALYEGGKKFHQRIDQFLVKLQREEPQDIAKNPQGLNPKADGNVQTDAPRLQNTGTPGGGHYASRKKRAWYTPVVAGIIDFMAAAVSQNPPAIIVSKLSDPKATTVDQIKRAFMRMIGRGDDAVDATATAYWHELNRDADGLGTDLPALGWQALIEGMIQKRSYLYVVFPKMQDGQSVAEAEAEGGLDAKIGRLCARDVTDWSVNSRGALTMIRVYTCERIRSLPFAQPDSQRHTWTYFTENAIYQYSFTHKDSEPPTPERSVLRMTAESHELGCLPVVPVRNDLWPMERLFDSAVALFNRETAATWSLDRLAYAQLVLNTNKQISEVITDQALLLDVGDSASILSPTQQIHDAQQKDIERLKESLFLAIQAMVLLAAAKDEQGRQSGVAKQRDFGSLTTLLAAFASPLKDALEKIVQIIQMARGDKDIALAIQGLDDFDIQSLELKLKNTASLMNLPMPKAARDWAILDTALSACANAPSEVREQIVTQMMTGIETSSTGTDALGKLPLAMQQLALARQRFVETGDTRRADKVAKVMDEMLVEISTTNSGEA